MGLIVKTDGNIVRKLVTNEHWKMVQTKVQWLAEHINFKDEYSKDKVIGSTDKIQAPSGNINFKTTERFVEFLVYVSQTCTSFVSSLKGIYLILNSWRPRRNTDGWPLTEYERDGDGIREDDPNLPLCVTMVPSFKLDMHALLMLTFYKDPPELPV